MLPVGLEGWLAFVCGIVGVFSVASQMKRQLDGGFRNYLFGPETQPTVAPIEGEATPEWNAAYKAAIRELDEEFPAALVEKPAKVSTLFSVTGSSWIGGSLKVGSSLPRSTLMPGDILPHTKPLQPWEKWREEERKKSERIGKALYPNSTPY